ncbi:MAG: hypothetical protein AAF604_07575 [Acidobacteriota bacterium]
MSPTPAKCSPLRSDSDRWSELHCGRRTFLSGVAAATIGAWWRIDRWTTEAAEVPDAPASTARGILSLRLQATDLDAQARFYGEALGFSIGRTKDRLRVQAGGTEIEFSTAPEGTQPIYHLAWSIPSNLLASAKVWLAERTPLLVHPDGRDEFHFRRPQRRAAYFADPAGNILEVITRDRLGDRQEGPFDRRHLLSVNHAGLVVDDMTAAIEEIRRGLGLELRYEPTAHFAQLGDEHRHLVLVTRQRLWLPERKVPAEVFATEVHLDGDQDARLDLAGYPYRLRIGSS